MLTYVIGAIVVILILIAVFMIVTYNALVSLRISIDEAFSTMDVYLKKRFDLIPNLVETVKGYAGHESSVLEELVKLRSRGYSNLSEEEKIEAGINASMAIPKIFALAENYPELKANENFKELSMQLERIEEDIANSRKYYNGTVKEYNIKVSVFPGNVVAGMFGFGIRKMYEITNESERENVHVKF